MNLCRFRNRWFSSHFILYHLPANVFHLFYFKMCCLLFMENIGWWISVRDEQVKRCLTQSQHGLIALYGEHKCNMYICILLYTYKRYTTYKTHSQLNNFSFILYQSSFYFFSAIVLQVWVASMFFQWKKIQKKIFFED